jgi:hypothetical protein
LRSIEAKRAACLGPVAVELRLMLAK